MALTRPAILAGRRIGLLGGSFNPAHDGHLHISRLALRHLALDEVWWLVSPQNPLKPATGMAAFRKRLEDARKTAEASQDRRIRVSGIEARFGTRYTVDTLRLLARRWPQTRFVWLMGADNLVQLPQWRKWAEIFEILPVAVFDRPSYAQKALSGKAARRFRRQRLDERKAAELAGKTPPAWVFLHTGLDPASATEIRARERR